MIQYAVFKTSNGELVKYGGCPEDMLSIQATEDETAVEITTEQYVVIDTSYYHDGQVVPRPSMDIVQSGDVFTNIPTDVEIVLVIGGSEYLVTDDNVDLTIDTPGTYKIVFRGFPYLDQNFEVVV